MRLLALLFLLFDALNSLGQVSATIRVDSSQMFIGDHRKMILEVKYLAGNIINAPQPGRISTDAIEFFAQSSWDTLSAANGFIIRKEYVFTCWDSGQQTIKPIPLGFSNVKGEDTIFTNQLLLNVKNPPLSEELADIKPIIEEKLALRDLLTWASALLIIGFVAFAIWKYWKNRSLPAIIPESPPVPLPPHEIALGQLEELRAKKLWQKGEVKAFHSELTHILRLFLEKQFSIKALEATTDEILEELRHSEFDKKMLEDLMRIFQTADLVKFAKAIPPVAFHDEALNLAENFIRRVV
jgi:hypothetical protein